MRLRPGFEIKCLVTVFKMMMTMTTMLIWSQIDRYLLTQRQRSNNCCNRQLATLSRYCCLVGGKRHGNYLTVTYLVVKLAYLANAVGQLFLLEYWLGFDYAGFGVRAVRRAIRGYAWDFGDSFPRVTLCAFQVLCFLSALDETFAYSRTTFTAC